MNKKLKVFLYIWLVAMIGLVLAFLKMYFDLEMDDDSGSEMVLSYLVSKGGWFLRKDWFYSTELRILNTELIYGLLFRFIKNWHTVRLVGNGIMFVILLLTVYYLTRQLKISKYFPVVGALFILPLCEDYYQNALHSAYLLPHLTFSVLMMAMFLHIISLLPDDDQSSKKKRGILFGLLCVLSLVIGLSGIRHVYVFFFPLFAAALWLFAVRYDHTKTFFSLKNRYAKIVLISCVMLGIAFVGFLVNHLILKKVYSFSTFYINNRTNFTGFVTEQFLHIFNGWLTIYGYQTGKSIFSLQLIVNLMPVVLLVLIYLAVKSILPKKQADRDENQKKQPKDVAIQDDIQLLFTYFYLTGVIILTLLFTFSTMLYVDRYITPVSVFAFPLIFMGVERFHISEKVKQILILLFCVFATVVTLLSMNEYRKHDTAAECRQVADLLVENGYYNGYSFVYGRYGNNLIEYTDGQLDIWQCIWEPEEEPFSVDNLGYTRQWLQVKEHQTTRPDGKIFLMLEKEVPYLNPEEVLYESENVLVYGYASVDALQADLVE